MVPRPDGTITFVAQLFDDIGVDPKAERKAIKADKVSQMRKEYQQEATLSNMQYGWVWVDDGTEPTVPVDTA